MISDEDDEDLHRAHSHSSVIAGAGVAGEYPEYLHAFILFTLPSLIYKENFCPFHEILLVALVGNEEFGWLNVYTTLGMGLGLERSMSFFPF